MFYFIITGCLTKRAQLPFSAWLPAAMAAPTPVSALVHSSTLVTAGVYVVFRLKEVFIREEINRFLFLVGGITLTLSGVRALRETDAKKIVALSTLRQLGLIIIRFKVFFCRAVFFHLVCHAFFKALLFIRVGNLIHIAKGYQDLRNRGHFYSSSPVTFYIISTCNFRLAGLPFLSGFYSKDLILEILINSSFSLLAGLIIVFSIILTVLYSARFTVLLFLKIKKSSLLVINEKDSLIYKSIVFIWGLALLGGAFISWLVFDTPVSLFLNLELKVVLLRVLRVRAYLRKFTNFQEYNTSFGEGFFIM